MRATPGLASLYAPACIATSRSATARRPAPLARPAVDWSNWSKPIEDAGTDLKPGLHEEEDFKADLVSVTRVGVGGVLGWLGPGCPALDPNKPTELYNIVSHLAGSLVAISYLVLRVYFISGVAWPQVTSASSCAGASVAAPTFPLTETAHIAALAASLSAFVVSSIFHTTQRVHDSLREKVVAITLTADRSTVYVSAAVMIWADAVVAYSSNERDGLEMAYQNSERLRLAGDWRPVGLDAFTWQLVAVCACVTGYEIFGRLLRETKATWKFAQRGDKQLEYRYHDEHPCQILRQQTLLLLFGSAAFLMLPLWTGEAFSGMQNGQRLIVYAYAINLPLIVGTFIMQHVLNAKAWSHAVWHVAACGAAFFSVGAREVALACARRGQREYLLGATCAAQFASVAPAFGGEDDWFKGLCDTD